MNVLDTNVLSELMRAQPDATVVAWIERQPRAALCSTCINQAEIFYGIQRLPAGRRRDLLAKAARALFFEDLKGRVLPFDQTAALRYAELATARRQAGRPIEGFDAFIAAIALGAGASVVTRDTEGFSGCGLKLINPWES